MTTPTGAIFAAMGVVLAAAPPLPAQADSPDETFSALDWTVEGELDALAAAPEPDSAAGPARSGPYFDAGLRLTGESIRPNGVQIGATFGLRARRDSGRRGLARGLGDCPPGLDECRAVDGRAPAGLVSGLHAAPALAPAGARGGIETAFVYARFGFGEVRAGLDEGAASFEGASLPGAFRLARADGGLIDPSGLAFASTRNAMSGQAAKITARSRRLAGIRLAASYTPDADWCGTTTCRLEAGERLAVAQVRDVIEAGASFEHRFRTSGQLWTASLTAARGRAAGPLAGAFQDPWTASARLGWSRGAVSLGGGALISNDGIDGGEYAALSASAGYERGRWLYAAEFAHARSDLARADGTMLQLGASYLFDSGVVVGAGVQRADVGFVAPAGDAISTQGVDGTHVFIEAGLRF